MNMTRKEKTQQNRFDKKIAPLLQKLANLCEEFDMPMITSVQLFSSEEDGARVCTSATHQLKMSLPMTLSTSLMNGTTKVRISDNAIQFMDTPVSDDLESLVEHAQHCEACNDLMMEAISRGECVDNILVPPHEDYDIASLLDEMKDNKLPFIIPKNDIVH
jgi:hypothetical protein